MTALGIPPERHESANRKLLNEWGPTILAIVVIYLVLNVVLPAVLSTRSPLMVVVSESMVPTLNVGDIIVVRGRPTYEVNDIVVYRTVLYSKPIVHRIISIKGEHYITKGDHNTFADPGTIAPPDGIVRDNIQGKVVFVVPKLGFPKYLLSRIFSG